MNPESSFDFSLQDEEEIVRAIQMAENCTSGEIRIHIDSKSSRNHFKTSIDVFNALKMYETKDRNAVLFHISEKDKNFTIIGDEGINSILPEDFWAKIKEIVIEEFKQKNYKSGLIKGIEMVGEILKTHFPDKGNHNPNELSDEISRS